jgi:hypothetical protein
VEDQQRVIDALPTDEPPTAVSVSRLSSAGDLGIHGFASTYPKREHAPVAASGHAGGAAIRHLSPGRAITAGAAIQEAINSISTVDIRVVVDHPEPGFTLEGPTGFSATSAPGPHLFRQRTACEVRKRSDSRRASGPAPVRARGSRRGANASTATRAGPLDESDSSDPDGQPHPLAVRETAGVAG